MEYYVGKNEFTLFCINMVRSLNFIVSDKNKMQNRENDSISKIKQQPYLSVCMYPSVQFSRSVVSDSVTP